MKKLNRPVNFLVLLLLLSLGSVPNTGPAAQESITVWHAWTGSDALVLDGIAKEFSKKTRVDVRLVAFETQRTLAAALQDGSVVPDVFFGDHTLEQVFPARASAGYCVIDGCPECFSDNPPPICPYALGNFEASRVEKFAMGPGYCLPDGCRECETATPPPWCGMAGAGPGTRIDVLQASFARMYEDTAFPYGIPLWWEHVSVIANPKWFEKRSLALPTDLNGLMQIVEKSGQVYYDPEFFARTGLRLPPGIERYRPTPASWAGILVASSDHFPWLRRSIGPLVPVELTDFRPDILVHGVFLHAQTKMREPALDFIYAASDEDAQITLFRATKHPPADGRALDAVGDPVWRALIRQGKRGRLCFDCGVVIVDG